MNTNLNMLVFIYVCEYIEEASDEFEEGAQ